MMIKLWFIVQPFRLVAFIRMFLRIMKATMLPVLAISNQSLKQILKDSNPHLLAVITGPLIGILFVTSLAAGSALG